MKRDISKLIFDGVEHSITEDKKHVIGPKKKYTMDEFREEKGKKIPILVAPPETVSEGAIFGFSNEQKMEEWLIKENLYEDYKRQKKIIERAKREIRKKTPEELKELEKKQLKESQKATEKFENFLKKHNLKPNEIDKIEEILEELDPHDEHPIHSLYLFEHTWWGGNGKILGGNWWRGNPHSSLGTFDNKTSSISKWFSHKAIVYSEEKYGGLSLHVYTHLADLNWVWGTNWNDQISSAIVF